MALFVLRKVYSSIDFFVHGAWHVERPHIPASGTCRVDFAVSIFVSYFPKHLPGDFSVFVSIIESMGRSYKKKNPVLISSCCVNPAGASTHYPDGSVKRRLEKMER